MINLPIKITFLLSILVFILIFINMFRSILFGIDSPIIIFFEGGIFLILGATLTVLILKNKIEGLFKKFLLLTGISAVGFFVFVVLHNLISVLLEIDEPIFFLLAVICCPIGFLVGSIGSIVLYIKQKNRF